MPREKESKLIASAMPSVVRPPYNSRESMSRPMLSVPSRCPAPGSSQISPTVAPSGASKPSPASATTIRPPMTALAATVLPNIFIWNSSRLPQTRIDPDRQHIGKRVQTDIGSSEQQAACLHHRQIAFRYRIDHQLPHAGIDKHHLDHDDANDQ